MSIIIYTCPKCGADTDEYMIATYPPIYKRVCTKCDWSYQEKQQPQEIRIPFIEKPTRRIYTINTISDTPSPCQNCSNNPMNGGSGICHCTLGTPIVTVT